MNLKKISTDVIPRALEKAERYRLLNEPGEAESICLDILDVDPDNQQAIIVLLLSLTDRFTKSYSVGEFDVNQILGRLKGDYERAYYQGIVYERRAKVKLQESHPSSRIMALQLLREAMSYFDKADKLHPAGNEDAALRWNTCARIINRNKLQEAEDLELQHFEHGLE